MTFRRGGVPALAAIVQLLLFVLAPCAAHAQDDSAEGFDFHVMRRINAHGDEYNSVAAAHGARRLVSGAGKVLLRLGDWGVRVFAASDGFAYAAGRVVRLASAATGETVREFTTDGDVARLAVSNNRRLLAASDAAGSLYLFDAATGQRRKSREKVESVMCVAPADDGGAVYAAGFDASIRRWDVAAGVLSPVGETRGQCSTLRLSDDGRRFVVGGNHHDVAVYDARTGERIGYYLSEAADFYMTNVWLSGDRLVYTADGGVLYDGELIPSRQD